MKVLKSFSVRLALTYAGLFVASALMVTGLYYWFNIHRPLETVRAEIIAESSKLTSLYRDVGPRGLVPILEARAKSPSTSVSFHALLSPAGRVLTANLPSWPHKRTNDWLRIDADLSREGKEVEFEALVLDRPLPDGGRLLIGRDIEDLDGLEEVLAETAIWLIPALLFMVMAGGFILSVTIGRRIEAVDAAARRVMNGDLSERVPVRGTGDDFDRLSTTLNFMLARIELSVEAVHRVSDSVAHELRTPLARLQAELLELDNDLPEEVRERFERVLKEAERLARIFDAVLRISRIEAGRHAARLERLDLSALLLDSAELYQAAAEERDLEFVIDIPPSIFVQGDADLLFQAVGNILDNAVKFTPPGGRISVAAGEASGAAWFMITDSGPGIPAELRDRVTERFFRAPSTVDTNGYGLGLSLVAAVASVHQSELQLSGVEPGLCVTWRFARTD